MFKRRNNDRVIPIAPMDGKTSPLDQTSIMGIEPMNSTKNLNHGTASIDEMIVPGYVENN